MAGYKNLTRAEVEELRDDYGLTTKDLNKLDERLNQNADPDNRRTWRFESEASLFRISLDVDRHDKITSHGQLIPGKCVVVQFRPRTGMRGYGFFQTKSQEVAKLIYISAPFKMGQCWDLDERIEEHREVDYKRFRDQLFKDPARLDRIKREIGQLEADAAQREAVGA